MLQRHKCLCDSLEVGGRDDSECSRLAHWDNDGALPRCRAIMKTWWFGGEIMDPEFILIYWLCTKGVLQVLSVYHQGNIFLKHDTDRTGGKQDGSGGGCKDCQVALIYMVRRFFPVMVILLFCLHQWIVLLWYQLHFPISLIPFFLSFLIYLICRAQIYALKI